MGYVHDELLEPGQSVEGVIIAQEDDRRIQRALSMTRNIRFMKYRVESTSTRPRSGLRPPLQTRGPQAVVSRTPAALEFMSSAA